MYMQYPEMLREQPVSYWHIDKRRIEQHAVKKSPQIWKSFEKYAINSTFNLVIKYSSFSNVLASFKDLQ